MTQSRTVNPVMRSAQEPVDSGRAAQHDWEGLARTTGGSAAAALSIARDAGRGLAMPGSGRTARRWAVLTALSAGDLTCGRVAEAHLDALAILDEAGSGVDQECLLSIGADSNTTWGVFAAEGRGVRLDARETANGWRIDGIKPWCSLAGLLGHALVTAHVPGGRRLFAVPLQTGEATVTDQEWVSRGLSAVPSGSVAFQDAPAIPVSDTDWYLTRPGFAWGGIGVAACWFGGLLGIARTLHTWARSRELDQVGAMHLGAADIAVHRCDSVLQRAADAVDAGRADGAAGAALAIRVRTVIVDAAEELIARAGHAMGPAPLAQQEEHARRVADLGIYIRQHHAERDLSARGLAVAAEPVPPW